MTGSKSEKGVQYVDSRRKDGGISVQRPEQHVGQLAPELTELAVVPALLEQLQSLVGASRYVPIHTWALGCIRC